MNPSMASNFANSKSRSHDAECSPKGKHFAVDYGPIKVCICQIFSRPNRRDCSIRLPAGRSRRPAHCYIPVQGLHLDTS